MAKTRNKASRLKHEYSRKAIVPSNPGKNPFNFFHGWFEYALKKKVPMANAMTLATVSKDKSPHARIVLLKDYGPEGFTFFTNYQSAKGREIAANKRATLLFYWPGLERQIRIEGSLKKTSRKASDDYFNSRPHNYQLGAWVSHQSESIKNRSELEKRYKELEKLYRGKSVPRPPHWGGYSLDAKSFEFWHGKANRLHDRLLYQKKNDQWTYCWLQP